MAVISISLNANSQVVISKDTAIINGVINWIKMDGNLYQVKRSSSIEYYPVIPRSKYIGIPYSKYLIADTIQFNGWIRNTVDTVFSIKPIQKKKVKKGK